MPLLDEEGDPFNEDRYDTNYDDGDYEEAI